MAGLMLHGAEGRGCGQSEAEACSRELHFVLIEVNRDEEE